jgi:hypothetical protein
VCVCCRLRQVGVRAIGTSGEEVEVRQTPDLTQLRQDLQVSRGEHQEGGGDVVVDQVCWCMRGGWGGVTVF